MIIFRKTNGNWPETRQLYIIKLIDIVCKYIRGILSIRNCCLDVFIFRDCLLPISESIMFGKTVNINVTDYDDLSLHAYINK